MHAPLIILATVAFGNESSSSMGGTPLAPSRSDIDYVLGGKCASEPLLLSSPVMDPAETTTVFN